MTAHSAGSSSVGRKATLFCPSCGREGHAVEGWNERTDIESSVRRLYCPVCGTCLTSRPVGAIPVPDGESSSAWEGGEQPADD